MNPAPALHHDWRAAESRRAAALADIDKHLDNVKACIRWLVAQGVYIQDVKVATHNRPLITISASPLLPTLFKDDCASGQHGDSLLGRTMYDFIAIRFECAICWSEAKQ